MKSGRRREREKKAASVFPTKRHAACIHGWASDQSSPKSNIITPFVVVPLAAVNDSCKHATPSPSLCHACTSRTFNRELGLGTRVLSHPDIWALKPLTLIEWWLTNQSHFSEQSWPSGIQMARMKEGWGPNGSQELAIKEIPSTCNWTCN